jgi:hypothetical protein
LPDWRGEEGKKEKEKGEEGEEPNAYEKKKGSLLFPFFHFSPFFFF